jgi:tRNA pseudouridine(55) synthase
MEKVLNLYKNKGETPLACIERFKKAFPHYLSIPMTYAGRLDPLAEGVLLVLAGEEVYNKDSYQKLPKEYDATILMGVTTDTYDIVGIPGEMQIVSKNHEALRAQIKKLEGIFESQYPPYSSKPMRGKPLFIWAREGRLHEIEIPTTTTSVTHVEVHEILQISGEKLLAQINESLRLIIGDFRQKEILEVWKTKIINSEMYTCVRVHFCVGSGTYIRTLAHMSGGALLSLVRTQVGEYKIEDSK